MRAPKQPPRPDRSGAASGRPETPVNAAPEAPRSAEVDADPGNSTGKKPGASDSTGLRGWKFPRGRELVRRETPEPRVPVLRDDGVYEPVVSIDDGDAVMMDDDDAEVYVEVEPPARLSDRAKERHAERRRILAKRALMGAGIALILVVLLWGILFSPIFALDSKRVSVSGIEGSTVSEEAVKEQVSGFDGTSLLRLNLVAVSDKVQTISLVKGASVSRDWPRGLDIHVTLREPVACLVESDVCVAVDKEGVKLDIPQEQADALPHIALSDGTGDIGQSSDAMIQILGSLDTGTRAQVSGISVDKNQQFTLNLTTGASVFWGTADDDAFKASVLKVLLGQNASFYDVSSPRAPVTQ